MALITIVGGRNGQVLPAMLHAVREAREQGRRVIVYVPEQLTLQTERDLIEGLDLPGLIDLDVISPKKLRLQAKERAGGADDRVPDEFGRAMAIQQVMAEKNEELDYYRGMQELPGAVQRVAEALGELEESGLTPEEVADYARTTATGAQQSRLGDLGVLWQAYRELIGEHFANAKEAWTGMVSRLEKATILQGAELLVYGFDTVRPDLRELLEKAVFLAERTTVFLVMGKETDPDARIFREQYGSVRKLRAALEAAGAEARTEWIDPAADGAAAIRWLERNLFAAEWERYPEDPGDELTLYAAADPLDEADHLAAALQGWHAEGIPWSRMAVALPKGCGLTSGILARMRLYGIPYDTAEKTPAASHGVCRMLLGMLHCITDGYDTERLLEAAHSGYCTLNEEEAQALEQYARAHGVEGSMWRHPFTYGKDAPQAEALRRKLLDPAEDLREDLKQAKTATATVETVIRFLQAEQVWERLLQREQELLEDGMTGEAEAGRQVWILLMGLLDQMWTLLGERKANIRETKNMLESALNSASVSSLPETEGGVSVGEVGHMLSGSVDALILPGAQDGILTVAESGWLNDRERAAMEQATGQEIGISRERRGLVRCYDYYRTLTLPRRHLAVSWSLQDEGGAPAQEDGLVFRIRERFPRLTPGGSIRKTDRMRPENAMAAIEGLGGLLEDLREGQAAGSVTDWGEAVVRLLHDERYGKTARGMLVENLPEAEEKALLSQTAGQLFRTDTLSISRLESYAACPYKFFIDYGLRPVRREDFTFEDSDAGTFFHAALDRYMKTAGQEDAWPNLTDAEIDGRMDAVCAELTKEWEDSPLTDDALGIWQGEEYLRRVHYAARALTRFAANSDFRTIATEKSFGKVNGEEGGLPPLILTLADGARVAVQGTIDRIDTYENGEGIWLRVVDNKSREKKPDAAKMDSGEQLQLMIYLRAALAATPGARPAGAMFFPIQDREVTGESGDAEAIEEERLKQVRMKGLITADPDVVRAMDRDRKPYSVDNVFNKDGSVSKTAAWALEEKEMQSLMDAAEDKAAELCGKIRSGGIDAAPSGAGEETACRYCTYRTICHKRRGSERPRREGITFAEVARKKALRTEGK